MALELLLITIVLLCLHHYRRTRGLPPGPPSVPLLGTLDIFMNYSGTAPSIIFGEQYFGFREWCTIFLGPSLVLVLINDFKLAKELFAKDEFSGRCCISCKLQECLMCCPNHCQLPLMISYFLQEGPNITGTNMSKGIMVEIWASPTAMDPDGQNRGDLP